jgi:hypothetical protein
MACLMPLILRKKVQVSLPKLLTKLTTQLVMVMAGGRRLMRRRTPMMQGLVFRDWCGFVRTRGTSVQTMGSLVRRTTGLLVL